MLVFSVASWSFISRLCRKVLISYTQFVEWSKLDCNIIASFSIIFIKMIKNYGVAFLQLPVRYPQHPAVVID